ncbi:MAG: ferredoxin family protein [Deltaproteobacteria bacterium]|nr:ferredoxin family protein [Deltaproteobacteria bacterium]MBW2086509.1 ferredoxin family protein [Deltaproteobacteria bacterium]
MPAAAAETKAKISFREERCKGCGLCVEACPRKLIVVGSRLNNQGYAVAELEDPERCNGCALCAEMCPDVVIEVWR